VVIALSSGGKSVNDQDTLTVRPGTPITVTARVFIKQFKAPGGIWKKNSRGEWRFFKEVRGYSLGIGVGNMTLKKEKEEFSWAVQGEPIQPQGNQKTLCWTVPASALPGTCYTISLSTVTTVQVKTEGTASTHGIHVDYNLPGAGKRQLKGITVFHVLVCNAGK
jgi:hypothetical protein